jgi:hypothetical protein
MKRHKKYIIPLLALVALAIIASVTLGVSGAASVKAGPAHAATLAPVPAVQPAQPAAATTETASVIRPTVIESADFAVVYSSVSQLTKAADVVVRGQVTAVSYFEFNTAAYTRVTFKVSKCLKGDIAPGDQITIAEVGGVTTMAAVNGDKFGAPTAADAATKVSVQLDGAPLSQVGDDCLYFLGTGSIGVVPGTYHVPLGAFQGRFAIDSGVAKRFVPVDWQGGKYTALSMAANGVDQSVEQAQAD